ncbi:hypothetical protein [Streptomyces sp. NPDC059828]|uniref:hypothetical protein n=1 Tax=Streptomyces sp. NPDC059828 TaxID=3346965 RepID=UPI0036657465
MSARYAMSAVLSRHWRAALIAAAGFATMVGTSTVAVVAGAGAAEATAPSPVAGGEGGKGDHGKAGKEGKGKKGDHDKGDKGGHEGQGGHDGDKRHGHGGDGKRFVECDPNALVAAIVELNEESGGELVLAKRCTYTLTDNQDGNGLPQITQPISIHGNGATIARAANADQFRIFAVAAGGDLKLSHLTLTRGKTADDGSGGAVDVSEAGRLTLDHVDVVDNTVDEIENNNGNEGGGVNTAGITTIRHSEFRGNSSDDGAAVFNEDGRLEVKSSKFTRNFADPSNDGLAAIYTDGVAKISDSLISDNNSDFAGAIENDGLLELEKSAVINNVAVDGAGAIYGSLATYIRDSLIKGNTSTQANAGGIENAGSMLLDRSEVINNATAVSSPIGGSGGGGIYMDSGAEAAIRDSKVSGNQAPGNGAQGGGIFVSENAVVNLTDSKVSGNISDEAAGGIQNEGTVETHGKVKIIDNVPTNCDGSTNPVPNCFG